MIHHNPHGVRVVGVDGRLETGHTSTMFLELYILSRLETPFKACQLVGYQSSLNHRGRELSFRIQLSV